MDSGLGTLGGFLEDRIAHLIAFIEST